MTVPYIFATTPAGKVPASQLDDNFAYVASVTAVNASLSVPVGNTRGGSGALAALTTGSKNTAYGSSALAAYTSDTYSDAFGYQALINATGHANAAFGAGAGGTVTTAFDGVYIGADCGRNADASGDMTGDNNVGLGVHALGHVTSGRFNVALGNYALVGGGAYTGVPTALLTGSYNVGVGHIALGGIRGDANENVAVGYSAGVALTTGDYNIFVGAYSGQNTTTGSLNIAIGRDVQFTSVTAGNELNIGNLIRGSGLSQGGAPATGKVSVGLTDYSINPQNTLHVFNATQAGLRLDTGAGSGLYFTDFNQQTNGVLNITPPSAGYVNITGSAAITAALTIGANAIPLTLKSDVAGGTMLYYGSSNSVATGANTTIGINTSRGTVASPSAVVSGDSLSTPILVKGYDGAAYRGAAQVVVQAAATVSSGIVPGNFLIYTANTSGTLTLGFSMNHNQNSSFTAALAVAGVITGLSGTAIGGGANTQAFIKGSSTANFGVFYGTGDPSFSAAKGSLYTKSDATTTTTRVWVNTDGGTTWAFFTASA